MSRTSRVGRLAATQTTFQQWLIANMVVQFFGVRPSSVYSMCGINSLIQPSVPFLEAYRGRKCFWIVVRPEDSASRLAG